MVADRSASMAGFFPCHFFPREGDQVVWDILLHREVLDWEVDELLVLMERLYGLVCHCFCCLCEVAFKCVI